MLHTDAAFLQHYTAKKHFWLGIPSLAVTRGGRIFMAFYSGGVKEQVGNYALLIRSDDGKTFTECVAVAYEEGQRCFDPCLWVDPMGRLWFIWSRYPAEGVFAALCNDPDGEMLVWTEPREIGKCVMMNKPTVLSSGTWAFPIAVWGDGVIAGNLPRESGLPSGAFLYATEDGGETFGKRGGARVTNRAYDEHMFLEMKDGSLRCYVRTGDGIRYAVSRNGGETWEEADWLFAGPSSRFFIGRLPSGRILLVYHPAPGLRRALTAMLSDDEGETFPHRLLLDERVHVSYPDCAIGKDGGIHICYDRERGAFCESADAALCAAREVLHCRITEEDILQGRLVAEGSFLSRVAYKLTDYDGNARAFFEEHRGK